MSRLIDAGTEGEHRSCKNCGNLRCANSLLAFLYDECIQTKYQMHWRPKVEVTISAEPNDGKDCDKNE